MKIPFIALARSLKDHPLWLCETFTRGQAWVDLLILANHKDNFFYLRQHKVNVKRGQVGWSQVKLGERWKWSRSKVRKFLNDLEKEQQVIQHQAFTTQVLTIVNYNKYQFGEQLDIQLDTQQGEQLENSWPSTNNNDNNNNNDNKVNNDNKKQYDDMFERFWTDYPNKKSKKTAQQKFIKAIKAGASFDDIMVALQKQKSSQQWTKDNGQFIPHPSTWLNQERWNDEVKVISASDTRANPNLAQMYDASERFGGEEEEV